MSADDQGAKALRTRWLATGIVGAALAISGAVAGFLLLRATPHRMASVDSTWHFAEALRIASGDWIPNPALQLPETLYRQWPVDHYWGFHLLLAPFALLSDPETGMKAAASVGFATALLAIFLVLRAGGQTLWTAVLTALLMPCFASLSWRFLMLRGQQLLLPLALFHLWLAFGHTPRRPLVRDASLLAVAYLAMLSYQGAILLGVFHAAGIVGILALAGPTKPQRHLRGFACTLAGLALGLTVSPYMDAHASTWQFLAYHVSHMGPDRLNLYPETGEFKPFPVDLLVTHAEYGALLIASVVVVALTLRARLRGHDAPPLLAAVCIAALAAVGLTALSFRNVEYAVPLALAAFALWLPTTALWHQRFVQPTLVVLTLGVLAYRLPAELRETTDHLMSAESIPIDLYAGARTALASAPTGIVLNDAEADFTTLLWEYPDVRCVHGLSRYLLLGNAQAYADLWALYRGEGTPVARLRAVARFWNDGVRFVAARTYRMKDGKRLDRPPLRDLAESHPDIFTPVFTSRYGRAALYRIDGPALLAAVSAP